MDPRYYQMAFQTVFLIYGTWALGWEHDLLRIALSMGCCLLFQTLFILWGKQDWHSLKSAFITGLGLSLLLRGSEPYVFVLAAFVAIVSKFFIRYKGKHIFNPANIGIAGVILLTGKAWISPGQWGSSYWYPLVLLVAGLIVLIKVKRAETGLVFLFTLFALEFSRKCLYLGWPADLVFHKMSSGSLWIYALFMITDPVTTPNSRKARIIWSVILAVITFLLTWKFQIYEAPVWALFIFSPLTLLFDRIWKANPFNWKNLFYQSSNKNKSKNINMKKISTQLTVWLLALLAANEAFAFCGFYVAQAGTSVFNQKSEVIIVRNGEKQIITMRNDFKGDLKQFAMIIPVPVVLKRSDIKIVEERLFNTFDAYSAPRLVEYYDQNPCTPRYRYDMAESVSVNTDKMYFSERVTKKETGVKIEAQYSVDEYEITILSATQSTGLQNWLKRNGYEVPDKAKEVLEPYIKDKLKFFAVKVNFEKAKRLNGNYLRPIQISFNTKKFMLPIRLGMANSNGEQDLIIYCFTKTGRIETANYRTVEMPTAKKIPVFLRNNFANFYKDAFSKTYEEQGKNAVFVEYAWNVSPAQPVKCDPCTGTPPVNQDLLMAGIDWIDLNNPYASNIFFTRLHVRYSRDKFPEDLMFIETPNTQTYQVRHIITHPATGEMQCDEGLEYLMNLKSRRKLELEEMEQLAGWDAREYPYYAELGNDKKVPLKEDTQKEEKQNFFPLFKGLNTPGQPPFWVLPVMIAAASLVLYGIAKRRKKNFKSFP